MIVDLVIEVDGDVNIDTNFVLFVEVQRRQSRQRRQDDNVSDATFPTGSIGAIDVNRSDPNVIYVGSQHVWKSTNEGQSWTKISPDLTRHDPKTMGASGGPITKDNTGVETYATVFTIAPSPKDASVIWA